jgi:hypothetical protein
VVAGCTILVFELSNSATSRLTIKNGMCDGGAIHHTALQLHWTAGMLLDVDFDIFTWMWTQNDSLLKFNENLCAVAASWGWIFVHMPVSGRVKFWVMDKENTNTLLGVEPYESCWVWFLGNRMGTGLKWFQLHIIFDGFNKHGNFLKTWVFLGGEWSSFQARWFTFRLIRCIISAISKLYFLLIPC